jgi:hypothetical protein
MTLHSSFNQGFPVFIMSKPRLGHGILMFFTLSCKVNKIGSKATFGGSVASVMWVEQPTIEITTRIVISVRNHVVHVWHFQCGI